MHQTDPIRRIPALSSWSVKAGLFSPAEPDAHCALFAPLHYEPGYAYPLIVWLHGQGDDERQLMRIMPLVSIRNYVAVAPRGVCVAVSGTGRAGHGWEQSEEATERAEQRVFAGIELAGRRFHVSPQRLFLAGFGSGGTMAFRVAMAGPHRFAGVLSLCGEFPGGRTPLGCLVEARRLPIFLAVGRDSREYPSAAVCDDLRLFHAAGLSTTLRQYPVGQELTPQMLSDMDRWIIEQISSMKSSTEAADEPWAADQPRG